MSISAGNVNNHNNLEPKVLLKTVFSETPKKAKLLGTTLKRKIFSKTNDLMSVLYFIDSSEVDIKFPYPKMMYIKETSEKYIQVFIKGALIKIKEKNPRLKLKYNYFKNSDILERIKISNLNSISEFDLITHKMWELLAIDNLYR